MPNTRVPAPSPPQSPVGDSRRLTLDQVNDLDHQSFVANFGAVYEDSPWIAAAAWNARPFASLDDLHRALSAVVENATRDRQEALIRAHPDLVGKAARAGTLTRASAGEQAAVGLDRLSPAEIAEFDRLNRAYRERFGVPFVICARENKKETILAGFDRRLRNTRDDEVAAALAEIAKIARYRLRDLVEPADSSEPLPTP